MISGQASSQPTEPRTVSSVLEYFLDAPALVIALWSALGLLALLLLLRKPSRLLLVTNESGRLQISRHALHRLLETCCQQLRGIASARARVVQRRGKFKTYLRLKVRPDAKMDAIQGYLAQEITDIYRLNLGITNVGPIEIDVVGVVQENKEF
jgi:hypothetical protein